MADNIKYRFIQNVGDYFPAGYFGEDFLEKVQKQAGYNAEQMKALCQPYVAFKARYYDYKNDIINMRMRRKDAITYTHMFHEDLLKVMGYDPKNAYKEFVTVNEERNEVVPVRHILRHGSKTTMLIMEMQHLIKTGDEEPDGLFEQQYDDGKGQRDKQRYWAGQWEGVFKVPEGCKISPAVVNKAITSIFLLPEERRPHFILLLAGNTVFLFDQEKWNRGSYLMFTLDDLFSQASIATFRNYYALFHLLVCKETLAADSETVLMDALIEESYKSAYEVTKDLKNGVVTAVETLANEALYYMKYVAKKGFGKKDEATGEYDETDDDFEAEVKDDCLTIIYRLLFVFYAESRSELNILPTNDETYNKGYSLEMLRDLEQVRLISDEARNGYFFDESLKKLFALLGRGFNENVAPDDKKNRSFRVRHIDSPLFDDRRLKHLDQVRIRNVEWQKIICALSLSNKNGRCGRISYANLGVNQLGSVYESLLAYRGFYAEQDYIEVHKANTPEDGTFLIPYSRMDDFDISEVLTDAEGKPVITPKGTFVYRLNGRDRQKSASYYTPEVLTRSTVKYTLKAILDEVAEGKRKATDLLDLKILEPAMGAAAFQNEVINQLAEAYLQYQQQQLREAGKPNWRIEPDHYRDELQKVKAYIATHNVYGVDLNPTAIELGKLSLWLNVMHRDMETPFFSNRLAVGNAVVGAWLKVYDKKEVYGIPKKSGRTQTLQPNPWWEKAPHKVKFFTNKVNRSVNEVYHFLLPDANMLGVRGLREQKVAYPEAYRKMTTILADWKQAINFEDFCVLQRLSSKIDYLLKEYYQFQISIEKQTNNKKSIWGIPGDPIINIDSYYEKERLNDTRYRHDSAYFKLKMVMDYWCSLWFWEYEDAAALPTRKEYWADIEALLDVDNDKIEARTRSAMKAATDAKGQFDMFDKITQLDLFSQQSSIASEEPAEYEAMTQEESEIVTLSKEQLLAETQSHTTLFEDSFRFKIVKRYADRYHYFHPMLEFLEVFWLRDGFDIICGNPPWVLPTFDVLGVFSEKFPEVILQGKKAPEVRAEKDVYFEKEPSLRTLYYSDLVANACSNIFTNSPCLYPFLLGVQTDLYMCILENSFEMLSDRGFIGMVHPESIYDTAKLSSFRNEAYHRLRFHFQYHNELRLFAEVHHETTFSVNVYGKYQKAIGFQSIHNLFHPNTIDACFAHDGSGICHGVKHKGKWNTEAHKDRIVFFDSEALQVLAEAFEDEEGSITPKLINTQTESTIFVVSKLAQTRKHVRDYSTIITTGFHETGAVDDGSIERIISQPQPEDDIILNGPHIYVSTSFYKMPRPKVENNSSYDIIDYTKMDKDFVPTTCFVSKMSLEDFRSYIKGFIAGQDREGKNIYDCWLDYYKLGISEWVGSTSERTLSGGILTPGTHHIGTIVSTTFKNNSNMVELCGLINSIPLDFYMKITGASHVKQYRIEAFPLGIADKYKFALFVRTLMLNCLTIHYKDLWEEMWREDYKAQQWSINDERLHPFGTLHEDWAWDIPLRNYFERRQALVEIDVISAMALGLSLQDLETIYNIQFPVLQQNENDTWYDRKGNIVFTCSRGLTGVGVDRSVWEQIRNMQEGETYEHTITNSELYRGQKVTYYAPFTKCDRVDDYRRAWGHFEKMFNE